MITPIGERFCIKRINNNKTSYYYFIEMQCECGKTKLVRFSERNKIKSCGCLTNKKHGMRNAPTYNTWKSMRKRCYNKNDPSYMYYGGRGIKVSIDWQNFDIFFKDMGDRPEGYSLDRKDNNGDYCKENCRWATSKEQCRNKRSNRIVEINGVKKTVVEWSEEKGANNTDRICSNLNKGIIGEKAVFAEYYIDGRSVGNYARSKMITIDGITKSAKEWSKSEGVTSSSDSIKARLLAGWSPKEAVYTQKRVKRS